MDIEEHVLDEIIRLAIVPEDSPPDYSNRSGKSPEELRESLTVARTYLGDQMFVVVWFDAGARSKSGIRIMPRR